MMQRSTAGALPSARSRVVCGHAGSRRVCEVKCAVSTTAYQPTGSAVNGAPRASPPPVTGARSSGNAALLPPIATTSTVFGDIERMIQATFNSQQPGRRSDWRELEGNWVLYPALGQAPEAVVHFLGGPFVGAAPQISYRLFLEALSNRNILVVTTPYSTNLDQLRIADEAHFKFDRALRALGPGAASLPVYGVGHSLGAVVQALISARYAVQRAGNVLISFSNRPATDVIPFLSPFIAPSARLLGPALNQLAASPIRSSVESAIDAVRGMSPSALRQLVPLVEQLAPIFMDVGLGRQEFSPAPEETKNLIRTYYGVPRNLLLRFRDDSIDDTNNLAALLQSSTAVGEILDLSVRTLPGDHMRPMHQALVDLPPGVARFANSAVFSTGEAIGRLATVADQMGVVQAGQPLSDLSKGVSGFSNVFGGQVGGPLTDSMQILADEVASWMGTGAVVMAGGRSLPAPLIY